MESAGFRSDHTSLVIEHRARGGATCRPIQRGRDGTRYSRFHPANFLAHHLAKIVTAAVYSDALHIEEGVVGLKQRAHELALAGASAA